LAPNNSDDGEDAEFDDALSADSERLKRELEILAKCDCHSIVQLADPPYFEFKVQSETFGAYGEEWIEGKDLFTLFKQRRLTKDEAISLGLSLCDAVEELDRLGYVHRDIKPKNIMQREDDTFVLVDPGMALDRGGASLTTPGSVPGTTPYISPEQWDPTRKRDLDVRSDMFAIGIVLFEALTGRHPYYQAGMSQVDIMTAARSKARAEIQHSDLPEDDKLRDVIYRLLSKSPHLRYKSSTLLREALEAAH